MAGISFMKSGEEKEAPTDVLEIQRKKVVPNPPIRSEDTFRYSFLLKNVYNEEDAKNVSVNLYDSGKCDMNDEGSKNIDIGTIYGGSTKEIDWEFTAPTNDELGNMAGSCGIKYSLSYDFNASTRADFTAVGQDALDRASRSGESIQTSTSVYKSQGPIKIDVNFQREQPFLNGTVVPVEIIIRNKGDGTPPSLANDDIEMFLDGDSFGSDENDCSYPTEDTGGDSNSLIFLEGSTPPIQCNIPRKHVTSQGPTEDHTFKVDINDYHYELMDQKRVSVKPTYS